MPVLVAATALAVTLAGCAASSTSLPYRPLEQPPGARISAAYTIVADRARVEIDGGGRRLERAQIVTAVGPVLGGGSSVGATAIASFPLAQAGPAPWRVRVKLQGIDPVDVLVDEPAGSPKPAPR